MDPHVAARRVRSMIETLRSDMAEALRIQSVLEHANGIVMTRPLVNDYRAGGYNVVYRSLTANLVIVLNRMHDGVNQRPLAKQTKASFPVVFRLLEDDTVRLLWRQKAMEWIPGQSQQQQQHNADLVGDEFRRAKSKFEALHEMADGGKWLKTLRWLRDARVAHSLVELEHLNPPQYGYLQLLLMASVDIVGHLCLAVLGQQIDFKAMAKEADRQAAAFWEGFFRDPPVQPPAA